MEEGEGLKGQDHHSKGAKKNLEEEHNDESTMEFGKWRAMASYGDK